MASMMMNFRVKSAPSIMNFGALTGFDKSPMAPSKVPAGQIYLQKPGRGMPWARLYHRGMATTNTASSRYLSHVRARVTALFLSFSVGTLFKSSWISPSGHSQPQMVRPRITPYSSMMPSTYQPAR